MRKITYLLVLFILLSNCWNIKPIGEINRDFYLIFEWLYIIYGFSHFNKSRMKFSSPYFKGWWFIIAGILLSMLPATLYHNQSILQSLVSYRAQTLWLVIPLLFVVKPSLEELTKASLRFSIFVFFVFLLKYNAPSLFVMSEAEMELQLRSDETEVVVEGFALCIIPLFYYLAKLKSCFSFRYFCIVIFCLSLVFITQNRSTLFPVTLITIYSLWRIKSKFRPLIIVLLLVLGAYFAYSTAEIWMSLFNETVDQLSDADYNRNKALLYFLSPMANPSWLTYILGNGFLSAHSSDLMASLREIGVYNSDLGYIGFWNQFGLIPVFVFVLMIIRPFIKHHEYCFLVKSYAFFLIVTSYTIGYYGATSSMLIFAIYYYLYYINIQPE